MKERNNGRYNYSQTNLTGGGWDVVHLDDWKTFVRWIPEEDYKKILDKTLPHERFQELASEFNFLRVSGNLIANSSKFKNPAWE